MQLAEWADSHQRLAKFHGFFILDQDFDHLTRDLGRDLIKDFHRLDDTNDRVGRDLLANLHKRFGIGIRA